jgi:hypothetical protein
VAAEPFRRVSALLLEQMPAQEVKFPGDGLLVLVEEGGVTPAADLQDLPLRPTSVASGVVSVATAPRGPASGTTKGSRTASPWRVSRRAMSGKRARTPGVSWTSAFGLIPAPSACGACAITAARRCWPPGGEAEQVPCG